MTTLHPAALKGFAQEAAAYARGRPEYPPELLPWIRDRLGLTAGKKGVDIGAGTGKFTRLLIASGAEVTAIEPVAEMRGQLQQDLPTVTSLAGTAQTLPLAANSVNAVACAQAFHWFATPEALAEIHRVLVPGGILGLVWNVRDESVDWVAAIAGIINSYEGDSPRFKSGVWRNAFRGNMFSPPQEMTFSHRHIGTPQQVIIDRFLSVSFIAALPSLEKARVRAQLQALIDHTPELKDRAEVAVPYKTFAYSYSKIGANFASTSSKIARVTDSSR